MSRKVTVHLDVKLVLNMDENASLKDVVDELDYSFSDTTGKAFVEDETIENIGEVEDSR